MTTVTGNDAPMSEKPTIVEVLAAVMGEVQAVGKTDRNTQQGYDFRGIDAVVNAVGPVFRKYGVIPLPHASKAQYRDVQTSTGKPSRECTVTVSYRFYGPAGDFLACEVPGESMDFGDKGAPKAMSVAYRIALLQVLCIPTHDPEPDAQSYERAREPEPAAATVTQVARFDTLAKSLAAAESEAQLREMWALIVAAFRADEITTVQANALRADLDARRAEMVAGT